MIEFRNVKKIYANGTTALDNINFKINDGEFVFIIGASGAGKTTVTKLLLREEEVTSGKIIAGKYDVTALKQMQIPYYRRSLGFMFQDFRLFQNMTVFDNVAFAMRVIGEPSEKVKKIVPYILRVMNIEKLKNNYPREISGGEQQRVALARALVNNPQTIIADEPTGNIDPKMSHEIMELLMRINEYKKTVIVVTHAKTLVDEFKKRVITLDQGRLVSDRYNSSYNYSGDRGSLHPEDFAENKPKGTRNSFSFAAKNFNNTDNGNE